MSNPQRLEVRIGDWISEGWKMFTDQWKSWVTLSLGFFAVAVVPIAAFIVMMYVVMITTLMTQQGLGRRSFALDAEQLSTHR